MKIITFDEIMGKAQDLARMGAILNEYDELLKDYGIIYTRTMGAEDDGVNKMTYRWNKGENYENGTLVLKFKPGEPII